MSTREGLYRVFFKQKTAYEMRISDWSSDVCSSDLIQPGSSRNHSPARLARNGRDMGVDIPSRTDYVTALKPLLDAVGLEPSLSIVLFTLDESSYSRELAPLAGVYPSLKLGPAWWFHDSPAGMRRFRELTTGTAGFYNNGHRHATDWERGWTE